MYLKTQNIELLDMDLFFITFRHILILIWRAESQHELYLWIDTYWSIHDWTLGSRVSWTCTIHIENTDNIWTMHTENTEIVVSGFIQTKVLLENIEF